MKHKPLKAPKSNKELARQLVWLSEHMKDIGTSIEYYGEFAEWAVHGVQLVGAGDICREWAREIENMDK